jgi:hypothetical protein
LARHFVDLGGFLHGKMGDVPWEDGFSH